MGSRSRSRSSTRRRSGPLSRQAATASPRRGRSPGRSRKLQDRSEATAEKVVAGGAGVSSQRLSPVAAVESGGRGRGGTSRVSASGGLAAAAAAAVPSVMPMAHMVKAAVGTDSAPPAHLW